MSKKNSIEISESLEELLHSKKTKNSPRLKENNQGVLHNISENYDQLEDARKLKNNSSIIQISSKNVVNYIDSPPKFENIFITAKAFDEIIMLATAVNEISKDRWGPDSAKLEVYCYVLGDKLPKTPRKPQTITGIYIPYHNASEVNVVVPEAGILEVKKYIEQMEKVVLGWAHSHGHYKVYSSETDEVNHLTLLHDTFNYAESNSFRLKYIYGITVNDKGDHMGVILTQFPCMHIQRAEDHQFTLIGDPYSKSEFLDRYREIKAIVADRVNIRQPGPAFTQEDQINQINDQLLTNFAIKMRKAKNLLVERIPENLEDNFMLIQTLLENYDQLLLDAVEESFNESAKELIRTLKNLKDIR
ncbi:MAG: hypothetical protein K9W44_16105 [Candidatus Lokiarchaeota archaeon]|nr:hypothetical protein [Candidatus Harpocratesius repetitus]